MSASETAHGVASPSTLMPRRLLSDARLARLAGRGDQRAFEAIFERYHQELYRYCRAVLRDPDDAQDALQSTMASALRSLPGDERRIMLRPWLYRVAHNEAISILRQRANMVESDRLPELTVRGADSEAEARERLRVLVADLDELPERQRGALVMRELSGLSYAEIGAALNSSEAAARQTVYEARVALRELDLGRAMECDAARRALSERDGRMLRSRRLRAHLRACEPCSDFGAAISQRCSDLQALCPPLPAVVGVWPLDHGPRRDRNRRCRRGDRGTGRRRRRRGRHDRNGVDCRQGGVDSRRRRDRRRSRRNQRGRKAARGRRTGC